MPWYRHFLWPFAILYGLGVWFRNKLFDFGMLSSKQFELPIICIGNLETGGTGKSPLVHYAVKTLMNAGLKVAVLSRGYGRSSTGFKLVEVNSLSTEVGDEPLQTKLRFPDATVVVNENRVNAVKQLLNLEVKIDIVVMDDGFQHRWVKPSLNILTTPSSFPFWQNAMLPVGTLREAKNESKRAKALVLTGGEKTSEPQFDGQIFNSKLASGKPVQISGEVFDIELKANVVLLSGIANSHRFKSTASQRFVVLHHSQFRDHHQYTTKDIQNLREIYNNFGTAAQAVLTTEKDAVRLINSPLLKELKHIPVFYLPIDVEFIGSDQQEFDKMILAYGKHA